MAHDPEWHAEYLRLEIAEETARETYRAARKALDGKRRGVGVEAAYEAALDALRIAGKARWDFEMSVATVVAA